MKDLLCPSEECTGCAACYNICPNNAIIMKTDQTGFVHPQIISEKCVQCKKCTQTCPILNELPSLNVFPVVYAAYSKDETEILHSSSGGIFFECAKWIIKQQGIVVSAYMTDEKLVKFSTADSVESVKKFRGSKYVESFPSDIYSTIKKYLCEEKFVLFCGLPCQIAGLLSYLQCNYKKLYTIDLVCHGVPSGKLFQEYVHCLEKQCPVKSITFRYKNQKWTPLLRSNCKIDYSNAVSIIKDYKEDPYLTGFNKNIMFRDSCYKCKYAKVPRISDITIGDYMGLGVLYPFKYNASRGVSQVLINSNKGMQLFKGIQSSVNYEKRHLKECLYFNHNLWKPSNDLHMSKNLYVEYNCYGYSYIEKKYLLNSNIQKIKNIGKEILRKILGDKFITKMIYLSYMKSGLIEKADLVYANLRETANQSLQDKQTK